MVEQTESIRVDEGESREKQARSTIRFPYYDLDAAIDLARTIHATRGGRSDLDDLVGVLPNFSTAKSGAFRQLVSAASLFGLIEAAGRAVSLTNRGYQIISDDDDDRRAARADAFLAVPLFQAIFSQFRGRTLPPQVGMLRTIEQLGVVDSLSDRAYGVFVRSAEQAGFFEAGGRQYLVQPTLRRGSAATQEPAPRRDVSPEDAPPSTSTPKAFGGGGPQPPGIHPAIMGLLQLLPPEGSPFPEDAREIWLQAIGGALNLIYGRDSVIVTSPEPGGGGDTWE